MAADLISFDLIEDQKENIQSLPGGRSVKALASRFGPTLKTANPSDTRNLNDAIREEYEAELGNIQESDDPLDVYDRYVKWTLSAYPSAQATSESRLRPLLEQATKSFQAAAHYKNDPRYLKLWLHYIRLFADSPRETYAYLSRHHIGEGLALFYEEFAAWLEGVGRYKQAEEVYRLGLEREARPIERLLRKSTEFQARFAARPAVNDEPLSPALPTVRPALAAKVDPFAPPVEPTRSVAMGATQNRRPKLAIFNDESSVSPVEPLGTSRGWEEHGSVADRRKENVVAAKAWQGEVLLTAKRPREPKLAVFKDTTEAPAVRSRSERVFARLELVYPATGGEFSFEELRAQSRGLSYSSTTKQKESTGRIEKDMRRTKLKEIRGETQTVKTNLESPTGPRLRRKASAEPTMTLHTRAATDDILDIFNQPLRNLDPMAGPAESEGETDGETDDDYTASTCTGRLSSVADSDLSGPADPVAAIEEAPDSVSPWSEFTASKHVPHVPPMDAPGPSTEHSQELFSLHDSRSQNFPEAETIPVQSDFQDSPLRCSRPRLPVMTPIIERTETSLPTFSSQSERQYVPTKTPCRKLPEIDEAALSSPFQEIVNEARPPKVSKFKVSPPPSKALIHDRQCNPVDPAIRAVILEQALPMLELHDLRGSKLGMSAEIRKFVRNKAKSDKTTTILIPPVLPFGCYTIKKELGKGAFAPVYLAETAEGRSVAIKCEDPPTAWEYYVITALHQRLEPCARDSIRLLRAEALYLYDDEGYLVEDYLPHGTLLDWINQAESKPGLEENVAMFFAIEAIRAVEAMHSIDILHGDLKADNCLVRWTDSDWDSQYQADGQQGWEARGLCLIDFGRSIDLRQFDSETQFIADWKTSKQDCIEMRELRPWKHQIDYFGLAGIVHSLLFGKYIEDMTLDDRRCESVGKRKRYGIRENLKRYWQTEIWSSLFDLLLNPLCYEAVGERLQAIRQQMEAWLEGEGGRRNGGLRSALCRLEERVRGRR